MNKKTKEKPTNKKKNFSFPEKKNVIKNKTIVQITHTAPYVCVHIIIVIKINKAKNISTTMTHKQHRTQRENEQQNKI